MNKQDLFELEKQYKSTPYDAQKADAILFYCMKRNLTDEFLKYFYEFEDIFVIPENNWIFLIDFHFQQNNYVEMNKLFEKAMQNGKSTFYNISFKSKISKMDQQKKIRLKLYLKKQQVCFIMILKMVMYFSKNRQNLSNLFIKRKQQINDDKKNEQQQINIQRNLYQRMLKNPYLGIDLNFDMYQHFEKDEEQLKKAKIIYEQSYKQVDVLQNIYQKINNLIQQKQIEQIIQCIQESQDILNQDQIIQLYEKVIKEISYDSEIWDCFIDYIKKNIKNESQQFDYIKRAAKSYPKELSFVRSYLRLLEKKQENFHVINYEATGFLKILEEPQEIYIIFQYLCEYHVRQVLTYPEDQQKVINLRLCFQNCIDKLMTQKKSLKTESEQLASSLMQYYSHTESYIIKDQEKSIQIMEKYIKIQGKNVSAWLDYIQTQISTGQINNARQLIKRACEYSKGQEIFDFYVQFERQFGTLENLELAENKLLNYLIKQMNNENDESLQEENEDEESTDKIQKKVKLEQDEKKFKDQDITIFLKNIPQNYEIHDIKNLFENQDQIEEVRIVTDKNGISKGFAYIDFQSSQAAQQSLILNNSLLQNKRLYVAISAPPKKIKGDQNTLFLNNLSYSITQDKIKQAFQDFKEKITDIRIIEENQKPKGYAYVEFETQDIMMEALDKFKRNMVIDNRHIDIDQSQHREKDQTVKRNLVVFLENLSFKMNENDIKQYFKEFEIAQIHLVVNARGQSRGFAYVQFNHLQDMLKVLEFKTGTFQGRQFNISKSNREIGIKKNKNPENQEKFKQNDQQIRQDETQQVKKSNDDFRSFLTKK